MFSPPQSLPAGLASGIPSPQDQWESLEQGRLDFDGEESG